MKKYGFLLLLLLPMTAFGAPSVRMLGNQPALSAASNMGAKVTPVKSSASEDASGVARIGTLRAQQKNSNAIISSSNGGNTSSRFPVIASVPSYNSVASVKTKETAYAGPAPASVDIEEIVNNVRQEIENNYYSKTEVEQKLTNVDNSITNIINNLDDSRFDAVRLSDPSEERGNPPAGYAYIWVEED